MPNKDFIQIGRVVKPHGIRGEVCIDFYADSPFLLDADSVLHLAAEGKTPRPFRVRKWRRHHGRVLLILEGINDRNAVDEIRGMGVFIRTQDLPELDDEELYIYELENCRILLEDGSELGVLDEVQFPADQEIWRILTSEGKEVLFPVQDEFVADVDLDAGVIVISPPPGLLEIYLES